MRGDSHVRFREAQGGGSHAPPVNPFNSYRPKSHDEQMDPYFGVASELIDWIAPALSW